MTERKERERGEREREQKINFYLIFAIEQKLGFTQMLRIFRVDTCVGGTGDQPVEVCTNRDVRPVLY